MSEALENRNLVSIRPLVPPGTAKQSQPVDAAVAETVVSARQALRAILHGRDTRRLAVIVGPCSIHDEDAALDYAERLVPLARDLGDALVIVMRTYFEKPRTRVGWKGLINDPRLDGSCDIGAGLALARRILLRVGGLGLPCASEILDPVTPQYIADLLSWVAIGARTTESQTHREMASGLSMPVGFKNGTDGGVAAAGNALASARAPHSFLGIDEEGRTAVVSTAGNPDGHLVLRGGAHGPNYSPEHVSHAAAAATEQGLRRGVMVDCSHDNSGQDHRRQGAVCRAAVEQFEAGQDALMGVMLESNLEPGQQRWERGQPLRYGVSTTDACIGWKETRELLEALAEGVRRRAPKAA